MSYNLVRWQAASAQGTYLIPLFENVPDTRQGAVEKRWIWRLKSTRTLRISVCGSWWLAVIYWAIILSNFVSQSWDLYLHPLEHSKSLIMMRLINKVWFPTLMRALILDQVPICSETSSGTVTIVLKSRFILEYLLPLKFYWRARLRTMTSLISIIYTEKLDSGQSIRVGQSINGKWKVAETGGHEHKL